MRHTKNGTSPPLAMASMAFASKNWQAKDLLTTKISHKGYSDTLDVHLKRYAFSFPCNRDISEETWSKTLAQVSEQRYICTFLSRQKPGHRVVPQEFLFYSMWRLRKNLLTALKKAKRNQIPSGYMAMNPLRSSIDSNEDLMAEGWLTFEGVSHLESTERRILAAELAELLIERLHDQKKYKNVNWIRLRKVLRTRQPEKPLTQAILDHLEGSSWVQVAKTLGFDQDAAHITTCKRIFTLMNQKGGQYRNPPSDLRKILMQEIHNPSRRTIKSLCKSIETREYFWCESRVQTTWMSY